MKKKIVLVSAMIFILMSGASEAWSAQASVTRLWPVNNASGGDSVTLWAEIENTGSAPLPSNTKVWFWASGPDWNGSHWVGSAELTGLTAGQSDWFSSNWAIPASAAAGNYTYWAQIWDSQSAISDWSAGQTFTVGSDTGGLPSAADLTSPNGSVSNPVTYIWEAVADSTWYYLWVNDTSGPRVKKWYTAAECGCESGSGNCSMASSASLNTGNCTWWIQTWNDAGYGPWSSGLSFTVEGAATTPAAATLISPDSTEESSPVTYTWEAVADSTWYYLWVNDTSGPRVKKWYTAAECGCESGSGNCSMASSASLNTGNCTWWIQTWNDAGYGPWSSGLNFTLEIIEEARYTVENYDPQKACAGTTLFTDGSNEEDLKVVEVDMAGNVVWQYHLTSEMTPSSGIVGFDAELLPNGNILLPLSDSGIYEIDRSGNLRWSHLDPQVSHDADLLADDTILYNFGARDTEDDAAVKVVDRAGNIQWEWYLKDHLLERFPPEDYSEGGWGHCNAVQRLSDGSTLISIRNFWLTIIVDGQGNIIKEYDWSGYGECYPHEPQIYEDTGKMIVCLQNDSPYAAVIIDRQTEEVLWTYSADGLRTTRDADILPNGNVLLTTVETGGTSNTMLDDISTLIEVTPEGEIVWQLKLTGIPAAATPGWFFKAQRIPL